MEAKVRESNIELLRIFAMAMIVMHHFVVHCVLKYHLSNITPLEHINNFITSVLGYGGEISVAIFIIICGFFMINSNFKAKHILNLYLYTLFYSLIFLVLAYIIGSHKVSSSILNHSLFPFFGQSYWFVSNYILLYLLIPFINLFINNLNKKAALTLIFILFIGWCIIPTFTGGGVEHSNIGIFILLYMFGAFIRLKTFNFLCDKKLLAKLSLLSLLIIIICICIHLIPDKIEEFKILKFYPINSPVVIIIALYLFNLFKSINIKYNKIINYISKSVLSIYLIHDNMIVRPYIWQRFSKYIDVNSYFYIFKFFIICILVFLSCLFIDIIFKFFINKPIEKLSCYLENILTQGYRKLEQKILNK